jgi:hypothetical protein
MKLDEILNKKIDYEVVRSSGSVFHTQAEINGRTINFGAVEEGNGEWELEFNEKKNGRNTYVATGSGGELEVFSMVKASIEEFVQRYHPRVMFFTADKEDGKTTRADLYDRLAKRFKIPGYTYKRIKDEKHDVFSFVEN